MPTNIKTLVKRLSPWRFNEFDELTLGLVDYLPIVPSSRLWLPQLGYGDDARFAELFRLTWQRVFLRDRRRLVRYWREQSERFPIQGYWSPLVALVRDWEFSDNSGRHPHDLAACGSSGNSLFFYAPIVDAMPPVHVQELIAHELAHAVLCAIGGRRWTDRSQPRAFDDVEIMADEIMELWGFDPDAMDQWLSSHPLHLFDAPGLGNESPIPITCASS